MIIIHTDGGARGNPGPSAIGIVITDPNRGMKSFGKFLGIATNNIAEYTAVLEALLFLLKEYSENDREAVQFFLDSQLVERQLKGVYKIKEPSLQTLALRIREKITEWGRDVSFTHVPREQNKEADKMVNSVLDSQK